MLGGDENGISFKDFCFQEWKAKYLHKPPWAKKDYSQLADALKRLDSEELARAAWRAFLASTDPFYMGHYPGLFLSSLAKWLPLPKIKAKPQKQVEGEMFAERIRILREVEADPRFPTTVEQRNEYARRVRELAP